jgi:glucose-6-phosphate 1-dehydrogenase
VTKRETPPPFTFVIFGAGGDLTRRLIVPALYNLENAGLLPDKLEVLGVDHNEKTGPKWAKELRTFIDGLIKSGNAEFEDGKIKPRPWARLTGTFDYMTGDFLEAASYRDLAKRLAKAGNVLFYLAVADRFFAPIVENLGKVKLLDEKAGFRRVIVEKPFGHDLASAKKLNSCLRTGMDENQIYRIDHFLGKETVQNIMALRFANGLLEPIWNRDRIDHVQITVAETIGIGTRGSFYEKTGALRDMVPNHLFQLLAMTAMEPPVSFDANAVRDRRAELLEAVHPIAVDDAVRGQYGAGRIGRENAKAYRAEDDVAKNSATETYVALKLGIDNWRWAGVPFYLRTGKRLSRRSTEIAIRFKPAPHAIFRETAVSAMRGNWLILRIQPDEGIALKFNAKEPGQTIALDTVAMDFRYSDWFKQAPSVGYETLIYDCLIGDATLFQRADQVERGWSIVEPVLDAWSERGSPKFPNYAAGSDGPPDAADLVARGGHVWRAIE